MSVLIPSASRNSAGQTSLVPVPVVPAIRRATVVRMTTRSLPGYTIERSNGRTSVRPHVVAQAKVLDSTDHGAASVRRLDTTDHVAVPLKHLDTCSLGGSSESTTGTCSPRETSSPSPTSSPRDELDTFLPSTEQAQPSERSQLTAHRQSVILPPTPCGPRCDRQIDAHTGEKWTLAVDEHGREKYFDQELASTFVQGAFSKAHTISPDEMGKVRETVRDKDGHITALGDESIYDEAVMKRWVSAMGAWHLKGFEQELRFRICDIYKEYANLKGELDDYLENADYIFFGLDSDATLKDLEREYRRLARLLHPDKNGGSDEAKAKFQDLKERYEALKKKIRQANGESLEEAPKEILDEGQDLDRADASAKNDTTEEEEYIIDRERHEKNIWELYHAAKAMQQQIDAIKDKLTPKTPKEAVHFN